MSNKQLSLVVPLAMAGLLLAALPAAHADEKQTGDKPAAKSVKPATTALQNGMVVVKDPVTGELRAPNAQEAAALNAVRPAQSNAAAGTMSVTRGPRGSVSVTLDDSTVVYATATRNADGSVSVGEAKGADAARKAASQPARQDTATDAKGAPLK